MALINYITQIQFDFGVVALLQSECDRVGIKRPMIVTDAGVRAVLTKTGPGKLSAQLRNNDKARGFQGISIGVASAPQDAPRSQDLMHKADVALYAAKNGGRGAFRFYSADLKDEAEVRRCFRLLRDVRDRARQDAPQGAALADLSMGMSGDYPWAIEEGATIVRVGQAVFGPRPLPDSHYWPS